MTYNVTVIEETHRGERIYDIFSSENGEAHGSG